MPRIASAEDDDPDDDDDWSGEGDTETNTFPCPACKREVYDGAEQCPYCKRYITDEDVEEQREHPHPPWIMATAIVLLILFAIGSFAIF